MANNWGKIACGAVGVLVCALFCLAPGGKDIIKGLNPVGKIAGKVAEKII